LETWQQIILLLIGGGLALFMFPGIKETLRRSEESEKDWPAVLIPVGLVILFVILLIALV
jgi:hypothetical protein